MQVVLASKGIFLIFFFINFTLKVKVKTKCTLVSGFIDDASHLYLIYSLNCADGIPRYFRVFVTVALEKQLPDFVCKDLLMKHKCYSSYISTVVKWKLPRFCFCIHNVSD